MSTLVDHLTNPSILLLRVFAVSTFVPTISFSRWYFGESHCLDKTFFVAFLLLQAIERFFLSLALHFTSLGCHFCVFIYLCYIFLSPLVICTLSHNTIANKMWMFNKAVKCKIKDFSFFIFKTFFVYFSFLLLFLPYFSFFFDDSFILLHGGICHN